MKTVHFKLIREKYHPQTTLGILTYTINKIAVEFCKTLEDTVRPINIKLKHHTAIPAGLQMSCKIHKSKKFGKVVQLLTKENFVANQYIKFSMIYLHGGTDHTSTSGCPIIAKNFKLEKGKEPKIWGSMQNELVTLIEDFQKKGYNILFETVNMPQND